MTPILIRCRNRADYLNITLKSLLGTDLKDVFIVIVDDCSDDETMLEYLYTNNKIEIENKGWIDQIDENVTTESTLFFNPEQLSEADLWKKYIGNIDYPTTLYGINDKFSIIRPSKNMGDLCGLYWTITAGFELFKNAERIIILEDDLIFNKNWFNITNFIYNQEKFSKLGAISVYNRENTVTNNGSFYKEIEHIGGVMYLIPRNVYDFLNRNKKMVFEIEPERNVGGDTHFQNLLVKNGFKIFNTNESYIQHIGVRSLARPGRFLRVSKNFLNPVAWSDKI